MKEKTSKIHLKKFSLSSFYLWDFQGLIYNMDQVMNIEVLDNTREILT